MLIFVNTGPMSDEIEPKTDIDEQQTEEQRRTFERVTREKFLDGLGDHDAIGLKWVFQALGSKDLKPEDAPSAGAWALWRQLEEDELMLRDFYRTVFPKLLPSKAQLEKGEDRVDDGRKLFGIIERLLREPDDDAPVLSSAERRARELAVSRTSA
jgi:hypothetical protein